MKGAITVIIYLTQSQILFESGTGAMPPWIFIHGAVAPMPMSNVPIRKLLPGPISSWVDFGNMPPTVTSVVCCHFLNVCFIRAACLHVLEGVTLSILGLMYLAYSYLMFGCHTGAILTKLRGVAMQGTKSFYPLSSSMLRSSSWFQLGSCEII